ncbi:MAG: hypothetical protein NWF07_00305 [Candidatus Bathyarchaeota archaeon]|nr:hypothetical protein [Candidatus Bathyarchaeota archaeon]
MAFNSRNRVIGAILIIILCGVLVGWRLRRGPESDVDVTLSDMNVERGEQVTLTIKNNGARTVLFSYSYKMMREYDDGRTEDIELDIVWPAVVGILAKGESWSQEIFTDLEPGKYNVIKSWTVEGIGESSYVFDLTIE